MFSAITKELKQLVAEWEVKLSTLNPETAATLKNSRNHSIKQLTGHMVDSASNNIHRTVYLQYRESFVDFPNYCIDGNNDRWIDIQNYQDEDWITLVQTWKYMHLHFIHVVENISRGKLNNQWLAEQGVMISLKDMITVFPQNFKIHLAEIEELLNQQ